MSAWRKGQTVSRSVASESLWQARITFSVERPGNMMQIRVPIGILPSFCTPLYHLCDEPLLRGLILGESS